MLDTKEDFLREQQAGRLGNYFRVVDTLEEAEACCYRGWWTVRNRQKDSAFFIDDVLNNHLVSEVRAMIGRGANPDDLYYQQKSPPDLMRYIQFEAQLSHEFIDMVYETNTLSPLRGIRDRGYWMRGAQAALFLRTVLLPESWDELSEIWQNYPKAIIEATEFSRPVGAFNRHLLIWEAREF